MGLNIKNERVCALARDVAQRTGQTQTSAIETALIEYLERILREDEAEQARRKREADARYEAAMEILREIDAEMLPGPSGHEIIESLYDPETGLPA